MRLARAAPNTFGTLAPLRTGMTNAKAIYTQGGNSKVYAEFTGTAAAAYTTSGKCAATADGTASGPMSLKSSVTAGAGATFKCLYPTTAVQATYQACRVGGLQTTTTTGCINPAQTITITESGEATTTIAAGTNPTITNKAGRTLQGFATTSTVTSKMYSGCAGCPYTTFMQFYNYYGDLDYADKWVLAALDATSLTYTNGQAADFSSTTGTNVYTRVDAVKKGTAYMNVWMYVIREFEDAIDDCSTSSIDNNYDARTRGTRASPSGRARSRAPTARARAR